MRIEARDLAPYASPMISQELKEGGVYFFVNYADDKLLVPLVQTVVFVGRNLTPTDSGCVYFQDYESYQRGVRYGTVAEGDEAQFFSGSEDELGHIFDFERALEELMRCSLRRRGQSGASTVG